MGEISTDHLSISPKKLCVSFHHLYPIPRVIVRCASWVSSREQQRAAEKWKAGARLVQSKVTSTKCGGVQEKTASTSLTPCHMKTFVFFFGKLKRGNQLYCTCTFMQKEQFDSTKSKSEYHFRFKDIFFQLQNFLLFWKLIRGNQHHCMQKNNLRQSQYLSIISVL